MKCRCPARRRASLALTRAYLWVDDQMDVELFGDALLDVSPEAEELLMTVARLASREHGTRSGFTARHDRLFTARQEISMVSGSLQVRSWSPGLCGDLRCRSALPHRKIAAVTHKTLAGAG